MALIKAGIKMHGLFVPHHRQLDRVRVELQTTQSMQIYLTDADPPFCRHPISEITFR